ncbi:MAG: hypothetical protein LBF61_10050 [Azoarcus sp.]|nr:hypothetical protein [Azoarcus sp.]
MLSRPHRAAGEADFFDAVVVEAVDDAIVDGAILASDGNPVCVITREAQHQVITVTNRHDLRRQDAFAQFENVPDASAFQEKIVARIPDRILPIAAVEISVRSVKPRACSSQLRASTMRRRTSSGEQ